MAVTCPLAVTVTSYYGTVAFPSTMGGRARSRRPLIKHHSWDFFWFFRHDCETPYFRSGLFRVSVSSPFMAELGRVGEKLTRIPQAW